MIKQLRYLCTLLLVAVASVAWGDEVLVYTLDGTQIGGSNGYTTESEITQNDITWMVMGNTTMNPWRIGGKNLTNEDRPLYSTSAIADNISRVVVTNGTVNSGLTVNSITLVVSSNSDFSSPENVNGVFLANSTTIFERPTDADWTNKYFKIIYNVTAGSSNTYVQFVKADFYKATSNPTCDAPEFTPVAGTYTSAQDVTISTTTENASIYYTLDDSEPSATNGNLYSEPIPVSSTTTIKAVVVKEGYNNSTVESATYSIVSIEHAGTESDPYTVADARNAIDVGTTGLTGAYATGIVSAIPTAYNSTYGNITFNFVDNEGEENCLQAYRCVGADGVDASDVHIGDVVVVYGNLKKYNSTYEFDAACKLVSLTHPAVAVEAPTFTPEAGTYTEAQSVTIACATDGATIYYTTDGTEPTNASTQYTGAISVSQTTTIKAIAIKGETQSVVATATYTIKVETVAVLPFVWEGGASANFLALDGVTAEGLGTSDYGETHNPYNIKLDNTGDYIQVNTDSQPGKVIVGVKMVGGATTSTITVQESADGVNFTNVQALSISGKQNDILTLETTNAFAADSRYVRLTFTKGSNVGVGPIKITKPATEIVAEETLEIDARATSGEIAYSIAYPQAGVDLTAAADVDWISGVTVASDKVTFTTTVNTGAERSGNITLTYGTLKKVVRVTQAAAPQMYTLTIGNPENVTITATYNVDQVINNGESAELENGTEVTFALTIPEGYALENVTVAGEEEGQAVEPTENATTPGVYTFTMPAFNVTINATVAKIETTTYTLATSVTPGKRYIIVGVNENTYKAMGEQKSNNRAAVEISVNDKTATVPSTAGAYEFVIDGNATDGYTIYDEVTPGYLYAAGGTKNNYLKTEEVPDESGNGTWTIEFDAEAKSAIIKSKNTEDNMRNWIRFNNSSSLFSCYASGQEDVYLYEKEVKGDVNKDGHITIADVTALVNIILGKVTAENNPDNYNFDAADVNNDGSPTIADVTELVNIILGKTN